MLVGKKHLTSWFSFLVILLDWKVGPGGSLFFGSACLEVQGMTRVLTFPIPGPLNGTGRNYRSMNGFIFYGFSWLVNIPVPLSLEMCVDKMWLPIMSFTACHLLEQHRPTGLDSFKNLSFGWWFRHIFDIFTPNLGEMIQFDNIL